MESENIKLAIIDTDGLYYQSCRDTIEESIQIFKDKFNNLLEKTQCTHYVGFYSNGYYFRNKIDPEYKGQRSKYDPPKWLKALKNWAITEYGFQYMDNIEADDLCAYWYNKEPLDILITEGTLKGFGTPFKCEKILCTPDKDLLQSIPSNNKGHFNYTYKLKDDIKALVKEDVMYQVQDEDIIKGWWVETNSEEAYMFKLSQLIVGDQADNVKGIEGKGIKYWEKMLESRVDLDIILAEYINKYGEAQGIYNLQKNYRLLHLLENDGDFIREINKLPEFPIITEIKKESNNIEF